MVGFILIDPFYGTAARRTRPGLALEPEHLGLHDAFDGGDLAQKL
jgi:hypothetical protein